MTEQKNPHSRDAELSARKTMTFEQADGDAIPSQLKVGEISKELRALLWFAVHSSVQDSIGKNDWGIAYIDEPWLTILRSRFILREHGMADEFNSRPDVQVEQLKRFYTHGNYKQVLGLTEWLLRQDGIPEGFAGLVDTCLKRARSAYAVYDNDTILAMSSEEESQTLISAISSLSAPHLSGPKKHLKNAGVELSNGNWADSVRESIHAVEAVAKIIAPDAKGDTLGPALKEITKKHHIHEAMSKGFLQLYGFTCDEKGIRHSLLEKGNAAVDAADAQYMLGACAAFVSYLLARARDKPVAG